MEQKKTYGCIYGGNFFSKGYGLKAVFRYFWDIAIKIRNCRHWLCWSSISVRLFSTSLSHDVVQRTFIFSINMGLKELLFQLLFKMQRKEEEKTKTWFGWHEHEGVLGGDGSERESGVGCFPVSWSRWSQFSEF